MMYELICYKISFVLYVELNIDLINIIYLPTNRHKIVFLPQNDTRTST